LQFSKKSIYIRFANQKPMLAILTKTSCFLFAELLHFLGRLCNLRGYTADRFPFFSSLYRSISYEPTRQSPVKDCADFNSRALETVAAC
jgi:hypothetical protein